MHRNQPLEPQKHPLWQEIWDRACPFPDLRSRFRASDSHAYDPTTEDFPAIIRDLVSRGAPLEEVQAVAIAVALDQGVLFTVTTSEPELPFSVEHNLS